MKTKFKFVINELGDSFVGVPISNNAENFNGVLKFNRDTAFVVELLSDEISYDELCAKVAEKFLMSEEETKTDVDMVLAKLREAELIEE